VGVLETPQKCVLAPRHVDEIMTAPLAALVGDGVSPDPLAYPHQIGAHGASGQDLFGFRPGYDAWGVGGVNYEPSTSFIEDQTT